MARTPLFASLRRALRLAHQARTAGVDPAELAAAPRRGPDRRTVLRTALGAAALAPLAAACGDNLDGSARVAVIGAGTAGLHCALRLAEAGVDVTVYEASARTGGRMFTDRGPYPNGKVIELGGELIDSNHTVMMALCDEFGLTLDDLAAGDAGLRADTFHFDGQVVAAATIVNEFTPLATRMATAAALETDPGEFTRLDNLSIPAWLAGDGMLPAGSLIRRILERAYVGEYGLEVAEQSVWNLLWLIDFDAPDPFRIFGDSDERYHIHEGNQALPDALAARLAGKIELGHELVAVTTQAGGRPVLTFDTDGGTVEQAVDRVVFALPFTLMRRLDLAEAGLTDGKQAIIRTLGYGTNAKLMMQFGSRPWRDPGMASGGSVSDIGELQATWETSRGYGGADGIITNFVGGARGVAIGGGSAEERAAEVLPWMNGVFPGSLAAYTAGSAVRQHWPSAPYALGSYACYTLGQASYAGLEGEAEGAYHFCGEHTSVEAQGYMEGAAETGLRAADEVLGALGLSPGPAMQRVIAARAATPPPPPPPWYAPVMIAAPLKIEAILDLLPHRFPFLLVDRVLELSPDKIVALKNVTYNEPYFPGHFPGAPVMPGVLQIEAMAQAGGLLGSQSEGFDKDTHVMLFMAIDAAKFRKPVVPGDQLIIEVVPLRKGKIMKLKGECRVDGAVVSSAEMLAAIAPRSKVA